MIYNVVLFSSVGTGGGSSETFFYDWSQIPDVPYKVKFNFITPINFTLNGVYVATIFVDLGQTQNKLAVGSTSNAIYKSSFLGFLFQSGVGTQSFLSADTVFNPPTYLNGRPKNNTFLVEIHNNNVNNQDYAPALDGYNLTLSFETID